MNRIKVLLLSLVIVASLISCKNETDKEPSPNGTYSIQIDGEEQNLTAASGVIDNKYSTPNNNVSSDGLRLLLSIALEDNTGVYISYNNTDLNADNVLLGDYTTNIDTAFSANDFKFGEVTLSGSNGYFSSQGTSTDAIKLTKCDLTGQLISGEFDALLTNKENNETIRVKGMFTDLNLMISL